MHALPLRMCTRARTGRFCDGVGQPVGVGAGAGAGVLLQLLCMRTARCTAVVDHGGPRCGAVSRHVSRLPPWAASLQEACSTCARTIAARVCALVLGPWRGVALALGNAVLPTWRQQSIGYL